MSAISISKEFTRYPGPRYRKDGPYSGEQFREEKLAPLLRDAIATDEVLAVHLDDVAGYGSSFLEEAFGGLLRHGFSTDEVGKHLRIVANTERFQHHRLRAIEYVREAAQRVDAA